MLDVSDDRTLNASMPDDSKRIPFTNMIYIGDGLSDVPCMKMMRSYGGEAIAVYQEENRQGVEELLSKGRVDFIFPADYRAGTDLEATVQNIIRKMAITDALTRKTAASSGSWAGATCRIRPAYLNKNQKKPPGAYRLRQAPGGFFILGISPGGPPAGADAWGIIPAFLRQRGPRR